MIPIRAPRKGFTLIEVVFASVIAFFGCMSIMGGFYFVSRAQRYARARTHAQTLAAAKIEESRQKLFSQLTTVKDVVVTVDDNRTPGDTSDDLQGKLSLIVRRASDGAELANATGEDYVYVEARVTWNPAATARDDGANDKVVSLISQFAP